MTTQTHPNIQFASRLMAIQAMYPGERNAANRAKAIKTIDEEMIRCGARDPFERDEWVPPSSLVPSHAQAFDLGRSVRDSARSRGLVGA